MAPKRSPAKRWCFTHNNYTPEDYAAIKAYMGSHAEYAIIGEECGPQTGTPHLQGYFCLKQKDRLSHIKGLLAIPIHLDKARGTCAQNRAYCIKEGKYWEHGTLPKYSRGSDSSLECATNELLEVLETGSSSLNEFMHNHPTQWLLHGRVFLNNYYLSAEEIERPNVYAIWVYGATGIGKSHFANKAFPSAYRKCPTIKWWNRYRLEKSVIIDEIDSTCVEITYWLKWIDRYKCTVETKGGDIPLHADEFIFTSNYPPEAVFNRSLDAIRRRLKVFEVKERADLSKVEEYIQLTRDIALIDNELDVIESNSDSLTEIIDPTLFE